jgi:glycosyltransferase involved in cell wall biosynthesis
MAMPETTNIKVSICICTYNGKARVGEVLAALSKQTLDQCEWELLLIDNASTDGTGDFAGKLISEKFGNAGRVVSEKQPGLSFARARAAQEARGQILCFLDDDNIPAADFVSASWRAFEQYPKAGVIGGKVSPRWEVKPTALAEVVAPFALAICDLGEIPKRLDDPGGGIVGAGLCVRRNVLQDVFKGFLASAVTDRKGSSLMSGGDLAISVSARQLGWECWYIPTLQIEHVMPASRMDKNYLQKLYEGIGRGQAAIRKCYDQKARSPLAMLIGLKDLGRWQLGRWRGPAEELRRRHPAIADDLHDLNQSLTLGRALQALNR